MAHMHADHQPETDSHADYLARQTPEARARLEQIQAMVEQHVPDAQRCIGYRIPAFRRRIIFIYFASFKNHIGIFPPVRHDAALITELAPYRGPKGNLSFPHKQPLPLDLIGRTITALAAEHV